LYTYVVAKLALDHPYTHLGQVVSALLFGKLSDKLGRYPCYLGALCFELVNPLFFALFPAIPGVV
jgi:MFS family permease